MALRLNCLLKSKPNPSTYSAAMSCPFSATVPTDNAKMDAKGVWRTTASGSRIFISAKDGTIRAGGPRGAILEKKGRNDSFGPKLIAKVKTKADELGLKVESYKPADKPYSVLSVKDNKGKEVFSSTAFSNRDTDKAYNAANEFLSMEKHFRGTPPSFKTPKGKPATGVNNLLMHSIQSADKETIPDMMKMVHHTQRQILADRLKHYRPKLRSFIDDLLAKKPTTNADCGIGPGGFQPGNTCASGGSGGSKVSMGERERMISGFQSIFKIKKQKVGYGQNEQTNHIISVKDKEIAKIVEGKAMIKGGGTEKSIRLFMKDKEVGGGYRSLADAKRAIAVVRVDKTIAKREATTNAGPNCGIQKGGFQKGNKCAKGGSGSGALEGKAPLKAVKEKTAPDKDEIDTFVGSLNSKMIAAVEKQKDVEQIKASIEAYVGIGFHTINSSLRGTEVPEEVIAEFEEEAELEDVKGHIKRLDKAIKLSPPLEEDTTLFRGVKDNEYAQLKSLKPGQRIKDKAYLSTTLHTDMAAEFADGEDAKVLNIIAPKGSKLLPLSIDNEAELLIARGATLEVVSNEKGKITLRLVADTTDKSTTKAKIIKPTAKPKPKPVKLDPKRFEEAEKDPVFETLKMGFVPGGSNPDFKGLNEFATKYKLNPNDLFGYLYSGKDYYGL